MARGAKQHQGQGAEQAPAAEQQAVQAQAVGYLAPQRRREAAQADTGHHDADVVRIADVIGAAHDERHEDGRDPARRQTNERIGYVPGLDGLSPPRESLRHCCTSP